MYSRCESYRRWDGLVWGLGLIAMGVLFLLNYLGFAPLRSVWVYWPLFVSFFGLMQLLTARSPKRVGGGVTMLLMGGWFLVATNHWYGLEWRNSWPLALVSVGLGSVARALASLVMRRDERDEEEKVDVLP